MSTIHSIRIKMIIPGATPVWFRKAWKGSEISLNGAAQVPNSTDVTAKTDEAIRGLRKQSPGAAYYWSCCLSAAEGPTMSFPHGICEPISDEPAAAPYFRGKEHSPYFHGAGINKS